MLLTNISTYSIQLHVRLIKEREAREQGSTCENSGRMVMPAWPPTTGTLTSANQYTTQIKMVNPHTTPKSPYIPKYSTTKNKI